MSGSAQPIAIACGDPAGIGPEVAVRAVAGELAENPERRFVLIGDSAQLARWRERIGEARAGPVPAEAVSVLDPREAPLPVDVAPGSAAAAQAGLVYLRRAAEGCLRGEFAALVTAPVNKEAILRAGVSFVGQTEFLADLAHTRDVTMMLLGDDAQGRWLRVALATTHVPLRAVADMLSAGAIERAIRQSHEACRTLGLPRARIAVCGLNPHAGEGGMLGSEERRVIAPAVAITKASGLDVHGPLPADTVFYQAFRGDYDVVVAMYHDQGLPPLKLVAFERGVNWTLGLPFPRTSPDHGTAFEIAGRGVADPSSMRAAIRLAAKLSTTAHQMARAPSSPHNREPR